MRKLHFLIFLFMFITYSASQSLGVAEDYAFKKIILGEFKSKNGFTASGTYSIPWLELETSHVTIDDKHRIYLLDKSKKRILQFAADGKPIKELMLKDVSFVDKSEQLGDEGYIPYQIQVSSAGNYIYITEGGAENNWAILDSNGNVIKKI